MIERAVRLILTGRRLGDLTAWGLALTGAGALGSSRHALGLLAVTGVAGAALTITSAVDLRRATTGARRAEAVHGIAWGLQSLAGVVAPLFGSTRWLTGAGQALGVGGGALQTGVGIYRLRRGIAERDRRGIIIGLLDTAAGASWLTASVSANPLAMGAFVAFSGVRVLYSNAGALKKLGRRVLAAAGDLPKTVRELRAAF